MPVIPETIGASTEAVNLVTWGTSTIYQFAVWYTAAGEACIGRITRGTHRWGINHTQYQFSGTSRTTLALPRTVDEHNIISVAVDGLGRIHVWANMHSAPMRAIRTVDPHTSNTWTSDSGWTSAASDFDASAIDATYPFPTHMPDGSLVFYIRSGDANSGSGRCDSYLYRRTAAGTSWSTNQMLFQGLSVPDAKGPGVPGDNSTSDTEFNWSAYPSGPLYCESPRTPHPGRLHCCWVWRLFALDSDRINVLPSYGYSDDAGVTWKSIDGTSLTVPITPLNATVARFPGHARITTITRASNVVTATIDQTAASAGFVVGNSYVVQIPSNSTFDGTFTIATASASQLTWNQTATDATAANGGYIGLDDYQNAQYVAVDDNGFPEIIRSITPSYRTQWTGTDWTHASIPSTVNGVTWAGTATLIFNLRGDIWMFKASGSAGYRRPTAFNLDGPGVVQLGGPIYPFGGWEGSYDPEAYRRFGTIEVLCCDGDSPRVYKVGNGVRAFAA